MAMANACEPTRTGLHHKFIFNKYNIYNKYDIYNKFVLTLHTPGPGFALTGALAGDTGP